MRVISFVETASDDGSSRGSSKRDADFVKSSTDIAFETFHERERADAEGTSAVDTDS
jgi:hypothetical protein